MLRLRELRLENEKTQEEMAKIFSISRQVYANYENEINEPSLDMLKKMADFFSCSIDFLLCRSDDFGNITIKKEKSVEISPDGKELLDIFNDLPGEYQAQILEYARYFETRNIVSKRKNKHGA